MGRFSRSNSTIKMDYYIINKIQLEGGEVKQNPVGYTTNLDDVESIRGDLQEFTDWAIINGPDLDAGNIDISEFFNSHENPHQLGQITDNIDGFNLNEITDINNLP